MSWRSPLAGDMLPRGHTRMYPSLIGGTGQFSHRSSSRLFLCLLLSWPYTEVPYAACRPRGIQPPDKLRLIEQERIATQNRTPTLSLLAVGSGLWPSTSWRARWAARTTALMSVTRKPTSRRNRYNQTVKWEGASTFES